jgi:hypothetical protein
VGTADEVHIIPRQELVDDGLAKAITDPSFIFLPIMGSIAGVGPQEIVEEAVIRHVRRALYPLYVVQRVHGRRKTAMNTEYFGSDDGCDREAVKDVDKCFPYLDVTSSFTFIVESVH